MGRNWTTEGESSGTLGSACLTEAGEASSARQLEVFGDYMTETCPAQVPSPALSHSRVWASDLGV